MNRVDQETAVVPLKVRRQPTPSDADPLGIGGAGGEPAADLGAGNAVVIPFPAGVTERPELDAKMNLQPERDSNGVGVALLAVQVSDYASLKVLYGDRMAAAAVDLFAMRLREIFRDDDSVVRASSAEYHVMLKSCSSREAAARAAQRILDQCTGLYSLYGANIHLSGNIGIVLQPNDAKGPEQLVQSARVALRDSNAEGDNTYRFYTDEIVDRLWQRASIASELAGAIEEGRLILHYQPQYDLAQRRLVGFEALLRLRTRTGELWGPDRFIEHAEKNGAIISIGRWVLREACRRLKQWREKGHPGLVMAVNVSPRQLADEHFPDMVEAVLAETGLGPADIELEVTERQMVGADPTVQNTISELSERNLGLAVDDFGTGYSSFAYLASLPIRTVKLDRGFLADVPGNARAQQLFRGLVKLLGELGLRLLAEGVETAEQEQFLLEIGCPCAQGFGLGVPLSAEDSASLFSIDD